MVALFLRIALNLGLVALVFAFVIDETYTKWDIFAYVSGFIFIAMYFAYRDGRESL